MAKVGRQHKTECKGDQKENDGLAREAFGLRALAQRHLARVHSAKNEPRSTHMTTANTPATALWHCTHIRARPH